MEVIRKEPIAIYKISIEEIKLKFGIKGKVVARDIGREGGWIRGEPTLYLDVKS